MARIRSIKPETWQSADFCDLSRDARLLYIASWNFADDTGRGDARPKQVKISAFPADDDIDVDRVKELLVELHTGEVGFTLYESDGKPYYHISEKSWSNQKIDRPKPPRFPEPTATFPRLFADTSTINRRLIDDSDNKEQVIDNIDKTDIRRVVDDQSTINRRAIAKEGGKEGSSREGSSRARACEDSQPIKPNQTREDNTQYPTQLKPEVKFEPPPSPEVDQSLTEVNWEQCGLIFGRIRKRYGHGGYKPLGYSKDSEQLSRVAAWANGDAGEWTAAQLVELSVAGFCISANDATIAAKYNPAFWWGDPGAYVAAGLEELKRWKLRLTEEKINAIRGSNRRDDEAIQEIETLIAERERISESLS